MLSCLFGFILISSIFPPTYIFETAVLIILESSQYFL